MSEWGNWRERNYALGLCITCGKEPRKGKIYCAEHAMKQHAKQRAKRKIVTTRVCSICDESGHDKRTHDLYGEKQS